jgi:hypothetical protein
MMLGDYANVLNEPRNPESSVFFAIAHRELGGSAEEALQVLSTRTIVAAFEGHVRRRDARGSRADEGGGARAPRR